MAEEKAERVCYVTTYDFEKYGIKTVDPSHLSSAHSCCVKHYGKRVGGDGQIQKVGPEEKVLAINMYDGRVYETQEEILSPGQHSQCDNPDGIRGVHHYYAIDTASDCFDKEFSETIADVCEWLGL